MGAPFPSVRTLSQSLKINPNTAQKAVSELVREGLLEVNPGIGTLVADWGPASARKRKELLSDELERLLVEAKRLGVTLRELEEAVAERWDDLFGPEGDIRGEAETKGRGGDPGAVARRDDVGEGAA